MKTVKVTTTGSETSSTLDLSEELEGLSPEAKDKVLADIGELLIERTLDSLAMQKSPVRGYGRFKALSQAYREIKQEETGSTDANLDLTGDMISSLDYSADEDSITVGVFGSAAPKADGHNNLSGSSSLPTRRFLPGEGEKYSADIEKLILDEIRFAKAEDSSETVQDKLDDVDTTDELYAVLSSILGAGTRAKLRSAVLSSSLRDILEENDLLDLL